VALRILVADDNRSFAEVARLALERQGARVVGVAAASAPTMRLVAELRPDVVLVDMMLGDECGLDLAKQLVRDGCGDPPVVILTSAYPQADVAELIAASPAAGFVPKSDLSFDAIYQLVLRSGRSPRPCNGTRAADIFK
jgi:CheY-like chemotaxis protein